MTINKQEINGHQIIDCDKDFEGNRPGDEKQFKEFGGSLSGLGR